MPIYQAAPDAGVLLDITSGGLTAPGTYLLNITHRGSDAATVRVAITDGAAPQDRSWIEWDAALQTGDVLSRHPLPLPDGSRVYVQASHPGISVTLIGREE